MTLIFDFSETAPLGKVVSVDTHRVTIFCEHSTTFARATVGKMVAIEGRIPQEQLIAIVEKATRTVEAFSDNPQDPVQETQLQLRDAVQAVVIGTFRSREGDDRNVFRRGAETFPRIDKPAFLVEGGNLARFMGLLTDDVPEPERMRLGHFVQDDDAPAIANGDKFFQRHAAILGSTGSGKSWAVATILERASKLTHPNIIVLDMHGEYRPLSDPDQGGYARRLKIAGPGDLTSPSEDTLFLPYWLLNREEMTSMLVDKTEFTAANQTSRFTEHVRELKEARLLSEGRTETAELFTVDSPVPYSLADLRGRISVDNTQMEPGATPGKEKQGRFYGQFSRMIARMDAKIADRRYGFMFAPPQEALEYDWLVKLSTALLGDGLGSGIKIIDFSETPSDVLPVVTGVLTRLLYNIQFWMEPAKRTPVCLLCDEAHLYLPVRDDADPIQKQALGAFERVAKEGRKYGFSLVVVSQRPSDVSRTILSQCNNFLALRLTNEADQSVVKRLMPDALGGITDILPLLDTGEALVLGDAMLLPTRVRLDAPSIAPESNTRRFWEEWAKKGPDASAIRAAVESLRAQSR